MARRFEAEREKKMTPEAREEQKKRQAMDAKIKIGELFLSRILHGKSAKTAFQC